VAIRTRRVADYPAAATRAREMLARRPRGSGADARSGQARGEIVIWDGTYLGLCGGCGGQIAGSQAHAEPVEQPGGLLGVHDSGHRQLVRCAAT
jgi:hypothetical protein